MTRAFITYVRPLLEYCSLVWSLHFKQDIDIIKMCTVLSLVNYFTAVTSSELVMTTGWVEIEFIEKQLEDKKQ